MEHVLSPKSADVVTTTTMFMLEMAWKIMEFLGALESHMVFVTIYHRLKKRKLQK